jgi:hypothetical protein
LLFLLAIFVTVAAFADIGSVGVVLVVFGRIIVLVLLFFVSVVVTIGGYVGVGILGLMSLLQVVVPGPL